jgi:hypothetical protein
MESQEHLPSDTFFTTEDMILLYDILYGVRSLPPKKRRKRQVSYQQEQIQEQVASIEWNNQVSLVDYFEFNNAMHGIDITIKPDLKCYEILDDIEKAPKNTKKTRSRRVKRQKRLVTIA